MLTFADVAAEAESLAKRQPALDREAVLDHGTPEDQDVDPGIEPAGAGVLRHGERRLCCRRAPGLHPRHATGLQLGDNLGGDFVVEAGPARHRTERERRLWTSRVSATGAGSLSPSPQPVTENPSALSLSGRCGVSPQKGSAEAMDSAAGEGFPLRLHGHR